MPLRYEKDGDIAVFTIENGSVNPTNPAIHKELFLALKDFLADTSIRCGILTGAGERGFCAGGDIRMIAESGAKDAVEAKAFFASEYRLNHLMFEYPKPITAIVDGIVMGGGVGISEPAAIRVATAGR